MEKPAHFPQEPHYLWGYFHQFNLRPRPSRHEDKIRDFILEEAKSLNLKTNVDSVGNVVVYVPASNGYETHPAVIIQNHMDMVTDHRPNRKINFKTDPIETFRDGDWIKAVDTTLGADNGIGCSAALAVMKDKTIKHPPLELLFTIDEETGLKGAWGVDPKFFSGKRMLNLDTEEWGSFYIGCAGGIDYEIKGKYLDQKLNFKNHETFKITVSGFLGGHSGVDIHEQRGNAIKFLTDILWELSNQTEVSLHEIKAGKAHNIIPRDAHMILSLENTQLVNTVLEKISTRWKSFLPSSDQNFAAVSEKLDKRTEGISSKDVKQIANLLQSFPHGAHKYDLASNKELVALSNNLALCFLMGGEFYVLTSLRFFDREECRTLEASVVGLTQLSGYSYEKTGEYPSWKPVRENKLLDQMISIYEKIFHEKVKVTAIHAGLECGILRDKIGPIDAVSFGPTIQGAHSPDERVHIPSVEKFWKLFINILENL